MITNHTYTHSDGVTYQVIAHVDEDACRYTPDGYISDNELPRVAGMYQTIDTGKYTSRNTGQTVYVVLFEAQYDIDGTMGYTIMTTDPRCADYTEDQQDELVKALHQMITTRRRK